MRVIFFVISMIVLSWGGGVKRNNSDSILGTTTARATKGVASVLILFGHVTKAIADPLNLFPVGYLAVALFFFWSGYGLTHGYLNKPGYFDHFWTQRLLRILVPFLTAAILYTVGKGAIGSNGKFTGIDGSIFVDYSWYVFALLIFTGCFYLCFHTLSPTLSTVMRFMCITTAIATLTVIFWLAGDMEVWCYSNLAFLIGIGLCLFDYKLKNRNMYLVIVPVFCFVFYTAHPAFQRLFGYYNDAVMIISNNGTSVAASILAVLFVGMFTVPNKVSLYLGEYSYEIYLLHGLVISFLYKFGIIQRFYIAAVVTLVITVALAIPIHKLNAVMMNYMKEKFVEG